MAAAAYTASAAHNDAPPACRAEPPPVDSFSVSPPSSADDDDDDVEELYTPVSNKRCWTCRQHQCGGGWMEEEIVPSIAASFPEDSRFSRYFVTATNAVGIRYITQVVVPPFTPSTGGIFHLCVSLERIASDVLVACSCRQRDTRLKHIVLVSRYKLQV